MQIPFMAHSFFAATFLIDPRGRNPVTAAADSDQYFRTCCLSVRQHFSKSRKTKQLSRESDCGSVQVDHCMV